jgi:hypothetical protein
MTISNRITNVKILVTMSLMIKFMERPNDNNNVAL